MFSILFPGRTKRGEEKFFQCKLGKSGKETLFFVSERMASIPGREDVFASHGTFYVVPNVAGAKQLFTIAVLQFGEV